MKEDKLRQLVRVLQQLLGGQGFEQNFTNILEHLALDSQVPIVTLDRLDGGNSRVFSLWEQTFLTQEARDFLLGALYRKAITPGELEETLALLFTQIQGFADFEEVCAVLESVVDDPHRSVLLASYDLEYIH